MIFTQEQTPKPVSKTIIDVIGEVDREISDRRCESRNRVVLGVIAQPLDDHRRPSGGLIDAFTRDISTSGVGLISREPIRADLVAIRIEGPRGCIDLLVKVVRCEFVKPYYDIGCRIMEKM